MLSWVSRLLSITVISKLVAWAYFNGLLTESTCLHTVVRDSDMDIDKLYQLVSDIRNISPYADHNQACRRYRVRVKFVSWVSLLT